MQHLSADEELVLELKQCHLCRDVEWVPALVEQLKDDGLMDRETAATIAKLKRSPAKMKALLDAMMTKGRAGHLDKLADILEATHLERNRWLADAIWGALDMQQKQLRVDGYINTEAEHVVCEEFSPDKKTKMTDEERRKMHVLLMNRTQIEKNILTNCIEKTKIDGNTEKRQADLKDTAADKMVASLRTVGIDKTTSNKSPFDSLQQLANEAFKMMREVEADLGHLQEEQAQSTELMELDDDTVTVAAGLGRLSAKHAHDMNRLKAYEEQLDNDIGQLQQEVSSITETFEESVRGKVRILGMLQDEVDHFQRLLDGQRRERRALRREIKDTQARAVERRQSVEEMETLMEMRNNMTRRRSRRDTVITLMQDLDIL